MSELITGDVMVETDDFPSFMEKVYETVCQELFFPACSVLFHELIFGYHDSGNIPKDRPFRESVGDLLIPSSDRIDHVNFSMRFKQIDSTRYLGHVSDEPGKLMSLWALLRLEGVTYYSHWKQDMGTHDSALREEQWHNSFDEPDAVIELVETSEDEDIAPPVSRDKEFTEWTVKPRPNLPFYFSFKVAHAIESNPKLDSYVFDGDVILEQWVAKEMPAIIAISTPWVFLLSEEKLLSFIDEAGTTLRLCAAIGQYADFVSLIEEWKAATEVWSSPKLA